MSEEQELYNIPFTALTVAKVDENMLSLILWDLSFHKKLSKEAQVAIAEEAKRIRAVYFTDGWQKAVRTLLSQDYKNVYAQLVKRDGERCVHCGVTNIRLQIDHIKPVSVGGDNRPENLQLLCAKCNRTKTNHWNKEIWI